MMTDADVLIRLARTIEARRGADPESSHTAKLLAKGPAKCAEKFGEEAVEAIIEAVRGDALALRREAADSLYHLLVMLAAAEMPFGAVLAELELREGTSGVDEKASRHRGTVIERALSPEAIARCLALRVEVFIAEQGVSAADEQDGLDGAAEHWIVHRSPRTLGCARVRLLEDPAEGTAYAKIQRVAVAQAGRGTGLGARLMTAIMDDLAKRGLEARLDSQVDAVAFYERLRFVAEGPEFMDAGIAHQHMRWRP